MKLLRSLLLGLIVLIVVILAVGALLYHQVTTAMLPTHDGEVKLAGLQDVVEIKRNEWGVPHIYANNPHDLFFAQGYTHAQDRWWQMEFFRATGDGRLQELTGANNALMSNDVFIRTIGWRRAAERDLAEVYEPEIIEILQAFTDGVNAYIDGKSGAELAFEYRVLGITGVDIPIRPWTLGDTVVWQKIMAWDLGDGMYDIDRARLADALGEDLFSGYLPEYPYGEKPTIVQVGALSTFANAATETESDASAETDADSEADADTEESAADDTTYAPLGDLTLAGNLAPGVSFAFGGGDGIGSNNWVVSGDLTETGKPLLANDPHLGIQMPSIWYEIGLHCRTVTEACPYDVHGFTFAPFPGVVIGNNANIAWGFTNVGPDVMDLYEIKVNPENPFQYEWDGEWREMTVHEEVINAGDSDEPLATLQVRETHLGPIINDHRLDADGKPTGFNTENPLALRWSALDASHTLKAIRLLNTASNWDEFRVAASYFDAPSQNMVYADVDGNIGYQTPGLIPVRPAANDGLQLQDGSTSDAEWLGYIPFDLLPNVFNPPSGYVHSANEALIYPEYYDELKAALSAEYGDEINVVIGSDWDFGYRGQRIVERLESEAPFSVKSFNRLQADNKNLSAVEVLPFLLVVDMGDDQLNAARDWLAEWDFEMHMDSPHAALYANFWASLVQATFDDQLGDVASAYGGSREMWAVNLLLDEPDNAWWDDITTTATETRDDILKQAFVTGHQKTVEALGSDRAKWKWGTLHTTKFVSNPLGQSGVALIEDMVNSPAVMTSGSSGTVNATNWNAAAGNFDTGTATSFRMVIDLSNLDNSVNMHTTGQSGHPFSANYTDMIDSWRKVEFKPLAFSAAAVDAQTKQTLTLRP